MKSNERTPKAVLWVFWILFANVVIIGLSQAVELATRLGWIPKP